MSKVQPGENYWADVLKMASIVQPAADYWTVDRENLRTRLCDFAERKKQRAKWRNSFKNREVFWMNNKAIIEFGFRWIWRMLQISEGVIHLGRRPLWITPSLICRILHILLSLIQQLLNNERQLISCQGSALNCMPADFSWTVSIHCISRGILRLLKARHSAMGQSFQTSRMCCCCTVLRKLISMR